jgi:hypothetical protein
MAGVYADGVDTAGTRKDFSRLIGGRDFRRL